MTVPDRDQDFDVVLTEMGIIIEAHKLLDTEALILRVRRIEMVCKDMPQTATLEEAFEFSPV